MHNKDKYPAIYAEKIAAQEELDKLMAARRGPLDKMKKVQLKIQALEDEKSDLNEVAMKDIDQIRELGDRIGRLALAMGARTAG